MHVIVAYKTSFFFIRLRCFERSREKEREARAATKRQKKAKKKSGPPFGIYLKPDTLFLRYRLSEGSGEETGGTGPDEKEMDNRHFVHAFNIRKQGTSYFPPVLASSCFFCKQLRRKASGQTEIDGWPSLSSPLSLFTCHFVP